jgi:hypothetical protein
MTQKKSSEKLIRDIKLVLAPSTLKNKYEAKFYFYNKPYKTILLQAVLK